MMEVEIGVMGPEAKEYCCLQRPKARNGFSLEPPKETSPVNTLTGAQWN
jgi:hypothetical protein